MIPIYLFGYKKENTPKNIHHGFYFCINIIGLKELLLKQLPDYFRSNGNLSDEKFRLQMTFINKLIKQLFHPTVAIEAYYFLMNEEVMNLSFNNGDSTDSCLIIPKNGISAKNLREKIDPEIKPKFTFKFL